MPVLLSAHAEDLIAADAAAILRYLDREPGVEAVADTLLRTRRVRRHRTVIRAADRAELADGLRAVVAGADHPLVARSGEATTPRLAFVVPGQGNHWPAMGADTYHRSPVYRAEADKCAAAFTAAGFASPLRYLTTDADDFTQTEIQGAQFTHAVALAQVWRSCGILPDLTIGHSLGEVAAAYLAESITLPDAVAAVAARAEVVDGLPGRYGMAVLGVSADEAAELVAATAGWLEVSVVNAPTSVVVSGDDAAITAITETVAARGRFARRLSVNYPAHTSALEALRDALTARLPRTRFGDTAVQFIGSATGAVVPAGTDFADYWYANLRNTVRFDQAVMTATRCNARAFVELSAHPSLLYALSDLLDSELPDGPAVLVGSGHRDESLIDQLSANIAAAAVADPCYRWTDLRTPTEQPLRDFPYAPMHAVHLWATPEPLPPAAGLTVTAEQWRQQPLPSSPNTPVGVAVSGTEGVLAQRLRDAVERHAGAVSTAVADAEILVVVSPHLDQPDVVRAAAELGELIDAGLLNYVEEIGPRCRDVWLVTAGAEQVAPGEPAPSPAPAAIAAIHRSIGFEYADQNFHHLDLPTGEPGPDVAHALVDTLLTGAGENALREGPVLYRRTLGEEVPPAPAWHLRTGLLDNVVITGGSGTIGLQYAQYLAEHGANRIVLLSRRGADPETAAALAQRHGIEVVSPACDITDREQLAAVAVDYAGAPASLLIHAAGTATFATREQITAASLADMSAAKLAGLTAITDIWPMRADTRILLCSSVIGVWGGKGVAAYGAANRMLDVLAAQLRADGRHCFAVHWGLWEGSDIVDAAEIARVQRSGLHPMAARPAIEASLYDHRVDPLVLAADPERLQIFFGNQQIAGRPGPDHVDATAVPTAQAVRTELASVLNIADPAAVDLEASLFDLGVDSLLALELRKRIKRVTGRTVPLATLLGGITGTALVADLEESGHFA